MGVPIYVVNNRNCRFAIVLRELGTASLGTVFSGVQTIKEYLCRASCEFKTHRALSCKVH